MFLKVKKQDMKDCFTCPICNNLYDRATTISECLHTFCRKCIEDKIIQEKIKSCPICNVDLGVAPLDKLRSDSVCEDLKAKIFKQKQESVKEATKTIAKSLQYFRKKKKSQSSNVASSSKVSTLPESNPDPPLELEKLGEQVKAISLIQSSSRPNLNIKKFQRKHSKPQRFLLQIKPEQPNEKTENYFNYLLNMEQGKDMLRVSTSKRSFILKETNLEKDNEVIPISSNVLGKFLSTTDMEVTPRRSTNTAIIVEPTINLNVQENQDYVSVEQHQNTVLVRSEGETEEVAGEVKQHTVLISSDSDTEAGEKLKNNGEENQESGLNSGEICGEKPKENSYSPPVLRPRKQRNLNLAGTSGDAVSMEVRDRVGVGASNNPVWFSLVAVSNQNTNRPLPQISVPYLRVTNGNLPVSSIKKYLANKLTLESEDEVELWLRQEPVCSTLKLHNLVDWWVQTTPIAERRSAMVGSSGADFVMVLNYSRSHLFA